MFQKRILSQGIFIYIKILFKLLLVKLVDRVLPHSFNIEAKLKKSNQSNNMVNSNYNEPDSLNRRAAQMYSKLTFN